MVKLMMLLHVDMNLSMLSVSLFSCHLMKNKFLSAFKPGKKIHVHRIDTI